MLFDSFFRKLSPTYILFGLVFLLFCLVHNFYFISQNEVFSNIIEKKIQEKKNIENIFLEKKILSQKSENKVSNAVIPYVRESNNKEAEKVKLSTKIVAMDNRLHEIKCDPNKTYPKLPEINITPKHFKILVNPKEICKSNSSFVFNYIFNKVNAFDKRTAIRKTWGNKEKFPKLKIAFLVGQSTDDNINNQVQEEALIYGDIIVGSFIDSLRNLSFKSVMAWQWINQECKNADYILKIDDDTVLVTFNFMNFIDSLKANQKNLTNTYFCELLEKKKPIRLLDDKYFIKCEEYAEEYFKDFCCGVANIITPDLIPKLHEASYTVRSFFIDDVYVGFVTNHLRVSMIDIWYTMLYDLKQEIKDYKKIFFMRGAHTIHDIYSYWNFILKKNI